MGELNYVNLPEPLFSVESGHVALHAGDVALCALPQSHDARQNGSFLTRGNVESFLSSWIANYVLLDDNASQEVKAAYPLREARMVVTEVPGEPGAYRATLFCRPHFQLAHLSTSIRLVVNLPK